MEQNVWPLFCINNMQCGFYMHQCLAKLACTIHLRYKGARVGFGIINFPCGTCTRIDNWIQKKQLNCFSFSNFLRLNCISNNCFGVTMCLYFVGVILVIYFPWLWWNTKADGSVWMWYLKCTLLALCEFAFKCVWPWDFAQAAFSLLLHTFNWLIILGFVLAVLQYYTSLMCCWWEVMGFVRVGFSH